MKKQSRLKGFTLVEILIAFSVLVMFFYVVYMIFTGGSKTAEKGRWTNNAISEIRNTTAQLSLLLKSTSYPTTLLHDTIKEADKPIWYVKVPRPGGGGRREVVSVPSDTSWRTVMIWYCCEAEKPPAPGKIKKYQLLYKSKPFTLVSLGELKLEEFVGEIRTTSGTEYAKNASIADPTTRTKSLTILNDVASITIDAFPAASPGPIKIGFSCRSPFDPKTHKEGDIMITPNVGIGEL